jgi:hypothetical protein
MNSKYIKKFSFDFRDPFFEFDKFKFGFRIFTTENTYGPDPDKTKIRTTAEGVEIDSQGLFCAGQQKKCSGRMRANFKRKGNFIEWQVDAEHGEPIKSIGTLIRGIKSGKILNKNWNFDEFNPGDECILKYPKDLVSPLFFVQHGQNSYTFVRSQDTKVTPKRIAIMNEGEELYLEVIHEEDSRHFTTHLITPAWDLGFCTDCRDVINERMRVMEESWGLKSWEERLDVPEWARHIALVVNLHGSNWSGYVYNTFERQLEILKWISKKINGKYVLAYLPGWDGRYYYNYPLYEPDPDLGGEEGMKHLVQEAHKLGMHVIPMFGAAAANMRYLEKLGLQDSIAHSPEGLPVVMDWIDWDNDRESDEQVSWVNIGHPGLLEHIYNRISYTVNELGVDGVFLDINHFWVNDPNYNFFEGLQELVNKLHKRYQNFLVFGENWYDKMLTLTPLVHPVHIDQWYHEHIDQWTEFFGRYARTCYHLSTPCPGHGSTGVHERGFSEFKIPDPNKDVIPTLGVVEDTLPKYAKEVEEVIKAAQAYAERNKL